MRGMLVGNVLNFFLFNSVSMMRKERHPESHVKPTTQFWDQDTQEEEAGEERRLVGGMTREGR